MKSDPVYSFIPGPCCLRLYTPPPPPYWRRLTLDAGLISPLQKRDWQLVLNARGIPYCLARQGESEHIFLPAMFLGVAKNELAAFNRENRRPYQREQTVKLYADWPLGPALLLLPAVQYSLQTKMPVLQQRLPDSSVWLAAGKLDAVKVSFYHQWWRLATALTLHADAGHLMGNLFFGAIFLALLARLCGAGWAWLIAVGGGMLGNCSSLLLHNLNYESIGFSTSVFSALGGIVGIRIARAAKSALLPFGCALALLALLGAEGEHTDYGAHLSGLACGCLLGMFCKWGQPFFPQWLAGATAIGLIVFAWWLAFAA